MLKKSLSLSLFSAGVALLCASPALAATPQEILKNSLSSYNSKDGYRIVGQVVIDVNETRYASAKKEGPESGSFTLDFVSRALPEQDGHQDSEGQLTLSKAVVKGDGQNLELNEPLSFQWKNINPYFYGRIEKMPAVISGLLGPDLDLSSLVGQWFRMQSPDSMRDLSQINDQTEKVDQMTEFFQEMADKKALQVTRVEKRYKNPQGEDMVRVRLTINRSLIYKEYVKNLNQAYKIKVRTERNAKINELRTQYNKTIAEINKISAAANINLTQNKLDRIEMGMAQKDPKEECTWNEKANKSVCKTIGWTNVKVNGGMTFMPLDTKPIEPPSQALELESLAELL